MANKLKSRIPQYIAKIQAGIQDACDDTADHMVDVAREAAPSIWHPGPYARGALANSIHVVAPGRNDYSLALASAFMSASFAVASDPEKYRELTPSEFDGPMLPKPSVPNVGNAMVYAPMVYAEKVEYGWYNSHLKRHLAPQPYMRPAMQEGFVFLMARLKKVF